MRSIYGEDQGRRVEYIEAFEVSEYGAPLDAAARARLFPFLPTTAPAAEGFDDGSARRHLLNSADTYDALANAAEARLQRQKVKKPEAG